MTNEQKENLRKEVARYMSSAMQPSRYQAAICTAMMTNNLKLARVLLCVEEAEKRREKERKKES